MAGTDLTFGSLILCGGDPVDLAFYEVSSMNLGEATKVWYSMAHSTGMRFKLTGIENARNTLAAVDVRAFSTFDSKVESDAWIALVKAAQTGPASLIRTLAWATPRYTGTPEGLFTMAIDRFEFTDPFRVATYQPAKNKWEISWRAVFTQAKA